MVARARSALRLGLVTAVLGLTAACGWFAGKDAEFLQDEVGDPGPTCRPKELDVRGTPPWQVGDTTPTGWAVTKLEADHAEFVRITFQKDDAETTLEVAYNKDGEPGDWATERYRLMPAPGHTPPEELLGDAMNQLKAFAAAESGPPFVKRTEGVPDPYAGLPPCP